MGALVAHRGAGQTARFVTVLHAFDADATQCGVSGDHCVHPGFDQCLSHLRGLFVGHVRGDLDRQRYMFAVAQGQFGAARGQVRQQLLERITELQTAQARVFGELTLTVT